MDSVAAELTPKIQPETREPEAMAVDHSPVELTNVVLGHSGAVTSLCYDPLKEYYMSGSSDSSIKVWSPHHELLLTLQGHIMAVRSIRISRSMPYMFSGSEDKMVKCWDLTTNKVVRDYHGHISSVYSVDLDDAQGQLASAGRDAVVRLWDVRTRDQTGVLSGHKAFINHIEYVQEDATKLVSADMDGVVRLWDVRTQTCLKAVAYHSKGVRSFAQTAEHIITASTNGLKRFTKQLQYVNDLEFSFGGHDSLVDGNIIVNTLAYDAGVLFAGCMDGQMALWDCASGRMFQEETQQLLPNSLPGENGALCSLWNDGQLLVGCADKSIRVYSATGLQTR